MTIQANLRNNFHLLQQQRGDADTVSASPPAITRTQVLFSKPNSLNSAILLERRRTMMTMKKTQKSSVV